MLVSEFVSISLLFAANVLCTNQTSLPLVSGVNYGNKLEKSYLNFLFSKSFLSKAYLEIIGSGLMLLFSLLVLAFAALNAFAYRFKTNKISNKIASVKEVSSKKVLLMSMNPFETLWVDQDKSNLNEMPGKAEKRLEQNVVKTKSLTNGRKNVASKQTNDFARTKRALKTLFDRN